MCTHLALPADAIKATPRSLDPRSVLVAVKCKCKCNGHCHCHCHCPLLVRRLVYVAVVLRCVVFAHGPPDSSGKAPSWLARSRSLPATLFVHPFIHPLRARIRHMRGCKVQGSPRGLCRPPLCPA